MLDAPLSVKPHSARLLWTTVQKGGRKFNVQVRLCNDCIGAEIARRIDAMGDNHSAETRDGGLVINLVRAS